MRCDVMYGKKRFEVGGLFNDRNLGGEGGF